MEIRPRTDTDLEPCITFLRTVHEQAGYPVNWPAEPRDWLTPPDALGCWVITVGTSAGTSSADHDRDLAGLGDGDRVVGHVAVTRDGPGRAFVERLFIDPAETGAGLGRQLLDHCLTVAAEHHLDLALEVADNCHAAIALYKRAGWHETGRTPIAWGGSTASAVINFTPPTD